MAAGEEVLDAGDVGGDDGGRARLGRRGIGADRGEPVAGRAVGAALAVVEGVGRDAGDPAGGEDDDREVAGVEIVLHAADEFVAGGRGGGAGAGQARDRRAGAAGHGVEAEAGLGEGVPDRALHRVGVAVAGEGDRRGGAVDQAGGDGMARVRLVEVGLAGGAVRVGVGDAREDRAHRLGLRRWRGRG